MKKLFLSTLVLPLVLSFNLAWAKSVPEHPLIRPYPGSVLAKNLSKHIKYSQYKFKVRNPAGKRPMDKNVKGKYWQLLYEVRKPDKGRVQDISTLEFFENYKAAALEKGGKVVWEDRGQLVFTLPNEQGGTTWCRVTTNSGLGQQYLNIVDEKPFNKSLTFGPAQMKEALNADGRVRLYGILFDFDKASLKQESLKQLGHIITLLKENPGLKLEVQGHTDNKGSGGYNLELSQRRAETVVVFLGLFGVDSKRLTPKGCGETKPVAGNDTEEGRAKNRRVELVRK